MPKLALDYKAQLIARKWFLAALRQTSTPAAWPLRRRNVAVNLTMRPQRIRWRNGSERSGARFGDHRTAAPQHSGLIRRRKRPSRFDPTRRQLTTPHSRVTTFSLSSSGGRTEARLI